MDESENGDTVSPLHSKKFIAFLITELGSKALCVLILLTQPAASAMTLVMAITIVQGFVEAGYILGQASLDKFVHIASIARGNGEDPAKLLEKKEKKPETVAKPAG